VYAHAIIVSIAMFHLFSDILSIFLCATNCKQCGYKIASRLAHFIKHNIAFFLTIYRAELAD
jgi:hypothetical protein